MEGSLPNWANGTKLSIVSAAMPVMSVPETTPNSVVVCVWKVVRWAGAVGERRGAGGFAPSGYIFQRGGGEPWS